MCETQGQPCQLQLHGQPCQLQLHGQPWLSSASKYMGSLGQPPFLFSDLVMDMPQARARCFHAFSDNHMPLSDLPKGQCRASSKPCWSAVPIDACTETRTTKRRPRTQGSITPAYAALFWPGCVSLAAVPPVCVSAGTWAPFPSCAEQAANSTGHVAMATVCNAPGLILKCSADNRQPRHGAAALTTDCEQEAAGECNWLSGDTFGGAAC